MPYPKDILEKYPGLKTIIPDHELDIRRAEIMCALAGNFRIAGENGRVIYREGLKVNKCRQKISINEREITVWVVSPQKNGLRQSFWYVEGRSQPDTLVLGVLDSDSTSQRAVEIKSSEGLTVIHYCVGQPLKQEVAVISGRQPTDLVVFLNCHAIKAEKPEKPEPTFYAAALLTLGPH